MKAAYKFPMSTVSLHLTTSAPLHAAGSDIAIIFIDKPADQSSP